MNEQQWLTSTEPAAMLAWVTGRASAPVLSCGPPQLRLIRGGTNRKLRLFACAGARHVWHLLTDERSRRAVEVVERYVDGEATDADRRAAKAAASLAQYDVWYKRRLSRPGAQPRADADWGASLWPLTACNEDTAAALAGNGDALTVAVPPATQAGLLRDIFGSLFRPAPLDPAWLTGRDGLLVSMAQQMYDSRDFTDMRILADVLEEAGCTDEQVLGHVRGPGPHVRGCWFLDVLLGKS